MMVKLRQTLGMSSTQDKITNVNIQEKKELMDKMGINPAQAGGAFGLTKKEMAVMAAQEKIQDKAAQRAKRNVPTLGQKKGKSQYQYIYALEVCKTIHSIFYSAA